MRSRRLNEGDPSKRYVLQLRDFKTEEEQRQTVLIRYLTLEKFLSLLELEAVWFSRLGALQDKFEGTLPRRAHEISEARDREVAEKIPIPLLRPAALKMTPQSIETCRGLAAVNCWFLGKQESDRMWQDYGQDGKGVAVRSTIQRLSTSFQIPGDYAATTEIGRVQYVDFDDYEMAADKSGSLDAKAFLKEKSFAGEREIRIMTLNCLHSGCLNPDGSQVTTAQFATTGPVDQNRKGFYVKCDLRKLIEMVIVGPRAPIHFYALIKRLINRYHLDVVVERSSSSLL